MKAVIVLDNRTTHNVAPDVVVSVSFEEPGKGQAMVYSDKEVSSRQMQSISEILQEFSEELKKRGK